MSYMPMNPALAPRTARILCIALPVPPAICPSVLHTLLSLHTAPGQARGVPRHSSPDICCFRGLSGCGGPLGSGEKWQRPKQPHCPAGYYCLSTTSWWCQQSPFMLLWVKRGRRFVPFALVVVL